MSNRLNAVRITAAMLLSVYFVQFASGEVPTFCDQTNERLAVKNLALIFDHYDQIPGNYRPFSLGSKIGIRFLNASESDEKYFKDSFAEIVKGTGIDVSQSIGEDKIVIMVMSLKDASSEKKTKMDLSAYFCTAIIATQAECDSAAERYVSDAVSEMTSDSDSKIRLVNLFQSDRLFRRLAIYVKSNSDTNGGTARQMSLSFLGIPFIKQYEGSIYGTDGSAGFTDVDRAMVKIVQLSAGPDKLVDSERWLPGVTAFEKYCGR